MIKRDSLKFFLFHPYVSTMDVEYTWILRQGKNCRQLGLLFPLSFIDQFVYPVEGEEIG